MLLGIIFALKMNKLPPGLAVTQAYLETECKNLVASVEAMKVRNFSLILSKDCRTTFFDVFLPLYVGPRYGYGKYQYRYQTLSDKTGLTFGETL